MESQIIPIFLSAMAAILASTWLGLPETGEEFYRHAFGALLVVLAFAAWRRSSLYAKRPYSSGARMARLATGLFQLQVLVLSIALAVALGTRLEFWLEGITFATPLEGLAQPASLLGALTIGLVSFLLLRTLPRQLLRLRLKGLVSATAAAETLDLTALWIPVLALTIVLGEYSVEIGQIDLASLAASFDKLGVSLGIVTATSLGYLLPRLWLTRPKPRRKPGLWIVLPKAETVTELDARATASANAWPRLLDHISKAYRDGPITLVSPPNGVTYGEHLHLADQMGMLNSLFPSLEIQVHDWKHTLPPADRWQGIIHRQVHPTSELIPILLDRYLGYDDRILFLVSHENQMQNWQGRLPVDRTRVLRTTDDIYDAGSIETAAGYPVFIAKDFYYMRTMDIERLFAPLGATAGEPAQADTRKPQGIYISYRRQDAHSSTAWLADSLSSSLPGADIYRDMEPLSETGMDFSKQIERTLGNCGLVLAVIGPQWDSLTDTQGNRRLYDPTDFVRLELAMALKADMLVFPVLVEGATMPSDDMLPDELKRLTERNAFVIGQDVSRDVTEHLAVTIAQVLDLPPPAPAQPGPAEATPTPAGLSVYITYHREDNTGTTARRLAESLSQRLEDVRVTLDVTDIQLKVDLRATIQKTIDEHDVILALIGPHWVDVDRIEDRTGLFDPNSVMRQELAQALASGKRIIPLLAEGAPNYLQFLPEELNSLSRIQALKISDDHWEQDISTLLEVLSLPPDEQSSGAEFTESEAAEATEFTSEAINQSAAQSEFEDSAAATYSESVKQSPKQSESEAQEPIAPDSERPKVFISYTRAYSDYTQHLSELLQPYVELAYDASLKAGDDWISELKRMLDESDAVIAIVGAETGQSKFALKEIASAIHQEKLLLPVFVEPFEEPQEIWQFMAANNDPDSKDGIAWLGRLEGAELDRVLQMTAANILDALKSEPD